MSPLWIKEQGGLTGAGIDYVLWFFATYYGYGGAQPCEQN
jgi:hypothetical protein